MVSLIEEPFEIVSNVFYYRKYDNTTFKEDRYTEVFSSATLYVPYNTKEKYESVGCWKMFKSILENSGTSSLLEVNEEYGLPKRYEVYNMIGVRIRSLNNASYHEVVGSLSAGLYIINGLKVLVR